MTGVKEQVAGHYAERIAKAGYVTLVLDHRHFGESEGIARSPSSRSFVLHDAIENPTCTRHAAGTKARFRYAPSAPGRATGTSPREHRGHAHRQSRCGRRRRLRERTRSCLEPRGYTWGHRCRSWPRTRLKSRGLLDAGLDGLLSRPPIRGSLRAHGSCSRPCRSADAHR